MPRTVLEARNRWGDRVLLRQDPEGWRPVFPQPRHKLSMEARRRQLAAYIDWINLKDGYNSDLSHLACNAR